MRTGYLSVYYRNSLAAYTVEIVRFGADIADASHAGPGHGWLDSCRRGGTFQKRYPRFRRGTSATSTHPPHAVYQGHGPQVWFGTSAWARRTTKVLFSVCDEARAMTSFGVGTVNRDRCTIQSYPMSYVPTYPGRFPLLTITHFPRRFAMVLTGRDESRHYSDRICDEKSTNPRTGERDHMMTP